MRKYRLIAFFLGMNTAMVFISCGPYHNGNPDRVSDPVKESTHNLPLRNDSIYKAALNGDNKKISEMLKKGTDVNQTDPEDRTALMYAAYNGHYETVKILLNNNAIIDMRDLNGRTALMFAASGPFAETVRILLDHNAESDLADFQEHFTALMYAASEGHLENVKILLEKKANASLKDIDGDTALDFALKNNHPEVADLLKEHLIHNINENR